MTSVFRILCVPFVAGSLLLMGCGVPMAPEDMTATSVADQEAATDVASYGGASDDSASSLPSTPAGLPGSQRQSAEQLATLPSAIDTPSPTTEPEDAAAPDADGTPTAEGADATPDAGEEALTGEPPAGASQTPSETPASTATPEATATPRPSIQKVNQGFAQEFLTLLNAQRTGRGMAALRLNGILTTGATQYAGYMGTAGFFGHDAPDGSTPAARAGDTGYPGGWNGEALSAGQPAPQAALNALLASPPHAAILLEPTSVEVGIGYAFVQGSRYLHYWVVVTGIP